MTELKVGECVVCNRVTDVGWEKENGDGVCVYCVVEHNRKAIDVILNLIEKEMPKVNEALGAQSKLHTELIEKLTQWIKEGHDEP